MRSFLLALLLSSPLAAQLPNNELGLVLGHASLKEDAGNESSADTAGISFNRYWTPSVSTRFSATQFGIETFRADLGQGRALDMTSYSAAVEYHLRRDRMFSPYAGLGVALVSSTLGSRFVDASAAA